MQRLQSIAEQIGMKVEILQDLAVRLAGDAQVQLIWALYQFETAEIQAHRTAEQETRASPVGPSTPPLAPSIPSPPPSAPTGTGT